MTNHPINSALDLEGTEKLMPPYMDPRLLLFQLHQYPSYGNVVLLVILRKISLRGGFYKRLLGSEHQTT